MLNLNVSDHMRLQVCTNIKPQTITPHPGMCLNFDPTQNTFIKQRNFVNAYILNFFF